MAMTLLNTGLNHVLNGMATKFDIKTLNDVKLFPVEEDRQYKECCQEQLVLADTTGNANQNDISGFMFQVSAATDTLDMYLEKNGVEIAALNNGTYGQFYAIGSIINYSDQSLLTGYKLEWYKVLAAHGVGKYQIRVDYTNYAGLESSYSNIHILRVYSHAVANGTIRIESKMNGYMMRERINYKDIQFVDMIRVKGWVGNSEEKFIITNDIYANLQSEKRVVVQRKINQVDLYNLETKPLPKCIADRIRYYHFFANEIYISDYNAKNYDYTIQRLKLHKEEAFTFKYTSAIRGIIIRGKLVETVQDNEKTNC